ncbi:hypothetical protein HID58_051588 [Brassica napus]|uniref:Uncharacterized protein n=1 Tax=Brassica napus TaxID=3708 RepID=A0ABQ8A9D5_BRANA|nr:hypothetical protein HID58_051588 [Brassica napus]
MMGLFRDCIVYGLIFFSHEDHSCGPIFFFFTSIYKHHRQKKIRNRPENIFVSISVKFDVDPPPAKSSALLLSSFFATSLQSVVTVTRCAVASRLPPSLQIGGSSSSVMLSSVTYPPLQPSVNQTGGQSELSNLERIYSQT